MNLHGRDFLTLLDFTPDEITGLLDLAAELKAKKESSQYSIECTRARTSP